MTMTGTAIPLNSRALAPLADKGLVGVPTYDRSTLTAGIIHFGVGGFHRAHQAMVVDQLLERGEARDFAIRGVGVLPQDRHMADVMKAQDGLYTLVLKHPDGTREARVIGSIVDYLFAPDDPARVIEAMADPAIRIVSMTVTEGGYNFDQVTGEFMASNADVEHDLGHPDSPRTIFGFVVAALRLRRDRGTAPFTVMSCDNIQGNGHVAEKMFTEFARLGDADFADWMTANVVFPNSMVDRITPVTTDDDRAETAERFGIADQWPVVAEPFFQWVLQEEFGIGRPPYELAGVQLVDDVEPYELMKLRLLNVSHQAMTYFGFLKGHRYAHEAAGDPEIASLLRHYMNEEATPTLKPVPGIDLDDYKASLIERFSNSEVRDTLARLCAESSDRIPKWLLPVVRENLANGGAVRLSAAVCASWARYAEGTDEQGDPITVVDRLADELVPLARQQREDKTIFIRNELLFGDLATQPEFADAYVKALDSLIERGAAATVASLT